MSDEGMHLKSAIIAISIIGLIVLVIHTIYSIRALAVCGTCDRGLHIVILACTHITKAFFALMVAFIFVTIAAADVTVCMDRPILLWLKPYLELIYLNYTEMDNSTRFRRMANAGVLLGNGTNFTTQSSAEILEDEVSRRMEMIENCRHYIMNRNATAFESFHQIGELAKDDREEFIFGFPTNAFQNCMEMYDYMNNMTNIEALQVMPEFVGDCESATAELYNAYVCGFIIILCIDVILFIQVPTVKCRVAPELCDVDRVKPLSCYCHSSCSRPSVCSCCDCSAPLPKKKQRFKKKIIKCLDYHRFRQLRPCSSQCAPTSCQSAPIVCCAGRGCGGNSPADDSPDLKDVEACCRSLSDFGCQDDPYSLSSCSNTSYSAPPCDLFVVKPPPDSPRCSEQIVAAPVLYEEPRKITTVKHKTPEMKRIPIRELRPIKAQGKKEKSVKKLLGNQTKSRSNNEIKNQKKSSCVVCQKVVLDKARETSEDDFTKSQQQGKQRYDEESQLLSQSSAVLLKSEASTKDSKAIICYCSSGSESSVDSPQTAPCAAEKPKTCVKSESRENVATTSKENKTRQVQWPKKEQMTERDVICVVSKPRLTTKRLSGASIVDDDKYYLSRRKPETEKPDRMIGGSEEGLFPLIVRELEPRAIYRSNKNLSIEKIPAEKPKTRYKSNRNMAGQDNVMIGRKIDKPRVIYRSSRDMREEDVSVRVIRETPIRIPAGGHEEKQRSIYKSSRGDTYDEPRSISETRTDRPPSQRQQQYAYKGPPQRPLTIVTLDDTQGEDVCDVLYRRRLDGDTHNMRTTPHPHAYANRSARMASPPSHSHARRERELGDKLPDADCTCMKSDKGVHSNWQYRKFCKHHKKYTYY